MQRLAAIFSVVSWVLWSFVGGAMAQPPEDPGDDDEAVEEAEAEDIDDDDDDDLGDPDANPEDTEAGDADEANDEYGVGATVDEGDVDEDPFAANDDEDFFDEDDPWAEVEPPGIEEEEEDFGGPPINFQLDGYARMRLHHFSNMPVPNVDDEGNVLNPGISDAANAGFGLMRARFNPTISYGDPDNPDIALKMQIDLLDNVVFGDNARIIGTPLFAENPSATALIGQDLFGPGDVNDVFVRRLWLEMNVLIGQLRVGRQGSQGGLGLLFNDGNGFRNDFGDALTGTTFDRILFLTRPLTVANALAGKGADPTPLIFGLGYDWLVEDPIVRDSAFPTFSPTPDPTNDDGAPPPVVPVEYPRSAYRSSAPYAFVSDGADDVNQAFLVLAWLDPDFNDAVNPNDELTIGSV